MSSNFNEQSSIILKSNVLLHEISAFLMDTKDPLKKIDKLIKEKDNEISYYEELLKITKEEPFPNETNLSNFIQFAQNIDEKIEKLKKYNLPLPTLIIKSLYYNENIYITKIEPRIMLEFTKILEDDKLNSLPIVQQKSLLPLKELYNIFITRYPLLSIIENEDNTVHGAIKTIIPTSTLTLTPTETIKRLYITKACQYYKRMTQKTMERFSIRKMKVLQEEVSFKKDNKPSLIERLFNDAATATANDAATTNANATSSQLVESIKSMMNILLEGMRLEKLFIRKFFPHNIHQEMMKSIFNPLIDGIVLKELGKKIEEMRNLFQLFSLKNIEINCPDEDTSLSCILRDPLINLCNSRIVTIIDGHYSLLLKEKSNNNHYLKKSIQLLQCFPSEMITDSLMGKIIEVIISIIKKKENIHDQLLLLLQLPEEIGLKYIKEISLDFFTSLPLFTMLRRVVLSNDYDTNVDDNESLKVYREFQSDLLLLRREIEKLESKIQSPIPRKLFTAEIVNLYSIFLLRFAQKAEGEWEMMELAQLNDFLLSSSLPPS